jgi:hypothetical protein
MDLNIEESCGSPPQAHSPHSFKRRLVSLIMGAHCPASYDNEQNKTQYDDSSMPAPAICHVSACLFVIR